MRYAVYLTPPADAPLTLSAEAWLGRSAFTGAASPPLAPTEALPWVPARYGFHATMRAPFRLRDATTETDLMAAFKTFAAGEEALLTQLSVGQLSRFLALVTDDQTALRAAALRALQHFEPLRAPLTEAERARRKPDSLDARGLALLDQWGYPHVDERFTFHMTLTGPMDADHTATVTGAAETHFETVIDAPVPLVFALYREAEPNGPFTIVATAA